MAGRDVAPSGVHVWPKHFWVLKVHVFYFKHIFHEHEEIYKVYYQSDDVFKAKVDLHVFTSHSSVSFDIVYVATNRTSHLKQPSSRCSKKNNKITTF